MKILMFLAITIFFSGCNPVIESKISPVSSTTTTQSVEEFEELTQITQAFNHEACQYPDRWSNPQNGCDNADPANPECIDEMYSRQAELECIERKVKDYGGG